MNYLLFLLAFLPALALAQHSEQPQAESTTDLRGHTLLFSVEDLNSGNTYMLERTPALGHFLKLIGKKEEKIAKLDGRDAQQLDRDFVSRFLKLQYEIQDVEGKCEVQLRLTMKGEAQDVCKKDDKKTQEMAPFISLLSQRF